MNYRRGRALVWQPHDLGGLGVGYQLGHGDSVHARQPDNAATKLID